MLARPRCANASSGTGAPRYPLAASASIVCAISAPPKGAAALGGELLTVAAAAERQLDEGRPLGDQAPTGVGGVVREQT